MFRTHPSTIALANPCTESQDNMLPTAGGQFCNTCQKQVTDFTGFSDEEFIRYFQTHRSQGCGKFRQSQFALTIPDKQSWQPFQKIMKPAAALLVSFVMYGEADAQASEIPVTTQTQRQPDTTGVQQQSTDTFIFNGTLLEPNGEPAVGLSITVKGTNRGIISDENGAFSLLLPSDQRAFIVSSIGYEDQEIQIGTETQFKITLKRDGNYEDIAIGGYERYPAPNANLWYIIKQWFKKSPPEQQTQVVEKTIEQH